MKKINIDVIDSSEDSYLETVRKTLDRPILVSGKKNMVEQIIQQVSEGSCIRHLRIYGHGAEGSISVGGGRLLQPCKKINGDVSEWRDELARLRKHFCKNAKISLIGCHIGAGELGAKKLFELATLLGVLVQAPTGQTIIYRLRIGKYFLWVGDLHLSTGAVWQKALPGKKPEPIPRS